MTIKAILFFMILLTATAFAAAQSTEFTYQGRLLDASLPSNGNFDFEFRLFDAAAGGNDLGVVAVPNVVVSSGIFSVTLDFGAQFDGTARYLQIAVKPTGSPDPMLVLNPRQPLSSTPYAIRSLNSTTAETSVNSQNLGGQPASNYVETDDKRMSDARDPLPGSGNYIQNQNAGSQTANFNIAGRGQANVFGANMQFDLGSSRILSSPGTLNTFVGINNGGAVTSGERNTFVGRNTGVHNTTGNVNTFVGSGAGFENISGSQNSFFGYNAGLRVTSGSRNSFFGVSSGGGNLIGNDNAMFGFESGQFTTGNWNAFFGSAAGRNNSTGVGNAFFGREAGLLNSSGGHNAFVGRLAGQQSTTGSFNTFLGSFAGTLNTSGHDNTAIGSGANFISGNLQYATAIGSGTIVPTSNTIQLGRSSGAERVIIPGDLFIGGDITGGSSSFILNQSATLQPASFNIIGDGRAEYFSARSGVEISDEIVLLRVGNDIQLQNLLSTGGIDFRSEAGTSALYISPNSLVRVRLATGGVGPVCLNANFLAACSSSIRYKNNIVGFTKGRSILDRLRPVTFDWKSNGQHDLGLVAEEVAAVDPLLVTYNEAGGVEGVKYDRIGVVLINVVKEQQAQIDAQQAEIDQLKAIICEMNPNAKPCQ